MDQLSEGVSLFEIQGAIWEMSHDLRNMILCMNILDFTIIAVLE